MCEKIPWYYVCFKSSIQKSKEAYIFEVIQLQSLFFGLALQAAGNQQILYENSWLKTRLPLGHASLQLQNA